MKKHKVLPPGKMKVVPVVVAGKGANVIGAVQVMGPAEQLVHVQAVAGMPATLNGVQGIAGVPISGKAADATPTNVVPDVTISMNVRFPK